MGEWEDELQRFRKLTLSCWYLTGATGTGKSKIGLKLARRLDAEIISLDSMAVYKEMDIGTAKLAPEERQGIPHHLIDVMDPSENYSLARYVQEAADKIAAIHLRNKNVLFVGGTPLYLKALLRGIFDGPAADPDFREALLKKVQGHPPERLHGFLQKIDPVSAKKLHPNDVKRIVRALEVYEKTGKPISEFQKQFEIGTPSEKCNVYVLQMPREEIYTRINKRVDRMIYDGFLDEVKMLAVRKLGIGDSARQALGYKELFDYLDGKSTYSQAVEYIKQNTRNFAKKQETWFRGLCECRFIPADKPVFEGVDDEDDPFEMPPPVHLVHSGSDEE
ncbi:MAG: tRNA (adenosine(37)-N6)-dimethylallyltransferase MiaA [Planctomycetaceae bacterium]|jgi:tRNA dimethylallyltransferase|nr:tRNA (adenosine(37)-N6)-dimethylallyltransferase MiaA [Planctomycetaceae bacterium]